LDQSVEIHRQRGGPLKWLLSKPSGEEAEGFMGVMERLLDEIYQWQNTAQIGRLLQWPRTAADARSPQDFRRRQSLFRKAADD
jgi:hypothetical protein